MKASCFRWLFAAGRRVRAPVGVAARSWGAGCGGAARRAIALGLIALLFAPVPARACSSFFVVANGEMIFGNTLDWHTEEGLIFINKRNVTKRGLSWFPGAPVWTSRYASVTVNQWGRDFPSRGMNEAGLVFGEMTLSATQFPAADSRAPMENNQWLQYMLDTCATVEDVLLADRRVRINPDQYHSHYLFADRNGRALTMEWLNGQLVYHTSETLPIAALTNDTYDNVLAAYRANPQPVPGGSSAARFSRAADMIARYNPAVDGPLPDHVFAIIESVQNPGWTKWKLVFDVGRGRLMFQTLQNSEVRYVELGKFDFSSASPVQMLDLNAAASGDVSGAFVDYSATANREMVIIAAQRMDYGIDPPWLRDFYNYPATTSVAADDPSIGGVRDILPGASTTLSAAPGHVSGATCHWQIDVGAGWRDLRDGREAEWRATSFTGATTAALGIAEVSAALDGAQFRCVATRPGAVSPSPGSRLTVALPPPVFSVPIRRAAPVPVGGAIVLSASPRYVNGAPGHVFRWQRNGVELAGAMNAALSLTSVQLADAGLYVATVTGATAKRSEPAIVGLAATAKLTGAGEEVSRDVRHPNGHTFDQVLLSGGAAAITADAAQMTRTSFVDLDGDIVQVEFSGPGALSLVLDGAQPSALAVNYHQPDTRYVKGHAGIVITGATEQTNVSVFSVGRATAYDPTGAYDIASPVSAANQPANNGNPIFAGHPVSDYDGSADLAFIAIQSANGRFGGVRAGNANFFASRGHTGIYAPGVEFTGPVRVGDLAAFDDAVPLLVLGSAPEVTVHGGDCEQPNGRRVQVRGISRIGFTAGLDSHGRSLSAQSNRAVFDEVGQDVTSQVVVNPPDF